MDGIYPPQRVLLDLGHAYQLSAALAWAGQDDLGPTHHPPAWDWIPKAHRNTTASGFAGTGTHRWRACGVARRQTATGGRRGGQRWRPMASVTIPCQARRMRRFCSRSRCHCPRGRCAATRRWAGCFRRLDRAAPGSRKPDTGYGRAHLLDGADLSTFIEGRTSASLLRCLWTSH